MKPRFAAALILLLCGCASAAPGDTARAYLESKHLAGITDSVLPHCRGYGCRFIDDIKLAAGDKNELAALFAHVKSPAQERAAIKPAISHLETVAGTQNGTSADIRGTYVHLGNDQHDCVDESTNTTIYLTWLSQRGYLHHHDIEAPATRWPFFRGRFGPHRTAVIREKDGGNRYTVDSWFHDNGHPPEIIPLGTWYGGWTPADGPPADSTETGDIGPQAGDLQPRT